jgi:hypothetical protein
MNFHSSATSQLTCSLQKIQLVRVTDLTSYSATNDELMQSSIEDRHDDLLDSDASDSLVDVINLDLRKPNCLTCINAQRFRLFFIRLAETQDLFFNSSYV